MFVEKTIALAHLVLPTHDLRFYRSPQFLKVLCDDIKKEGMLVKPLVTPISDNHYQVVDGVNRIICAKKLGWETVKCDVVEVRNDKDIMVLGLKINLFRKSHDIMGTVTVLSRLKEKGMKQKDLVKRFGLSKGYVSKLLALTKLPTREKLALAKGQITVSQAYQMVKPKRSHSLMEKLGIEYKCDTCHSKVSFRERELIALCSECRSKLETVLRQERDRLSHEREQTELP